jgi:four helix bundle suffix protein
VKEQRGKESGRGGLGGRSEPEENSKQETGKTLENSNALKNSNAVKNSSAVVSPSTGSIKSTSSTPSTYPELAANAALVLIAVACSLLDRQLASLASAFEREGGFTERLHRVRTRVRAAG